MPSSIRLQPQPILALVLAGISFIVVTKLLITLFLSPSIESSLVLGTFPIESFKISRYEGEVSEVWVTPAVGVEVESLIELPSSFGYSWPYDRLVPYARSVELAELVVSSALYQQLQTYLHDDKLITVQVLSSPTCAFLSFRASRQRVDYLLLLQRPIAIEGCSA